MTKFKKHKGQLFRMLDKPVPLAPDSKLPCLVRLIQDDSPMGRMNRHYKPDTELEKYAIVSKLSDSKLSIIGDKWNGYDIFNHEIIGYPVEEGSAEWALWAMMDSKKVWSFDVIDIIGEGYVAMGKRESSEVIAFHFVNTDTNYECNSFMSIDEFLSKHRSSGWQIYKEPKPKTLLDNAWVGDLCKTDLDEWIQIDDTSEPPSPILYHFDRPFKGNIIHTEPLAPEGSAEWAWQMMLLGNLIIHSEYSSKHHTWSMDNKGIACASHSGMFANCKEQWLRNAIGNGWQLYTPEAKQDLTNAPFEGLEGVKAVDSVLFSDGIIRDVLEIKGTYHGNKIYPPAIIVCYQDILRCFNICDGKHMATLLPIRAIRIATELDKKHYQFADDSKAIEKPLLADAQVGDLCQRRDGEWVQIDGIPPETLYWEAGNQLYYPEGNLSYYGEDEKDIIHTEPLATEGSAEWAWQRMKLGDKVFNPKVNTLGGYSHIANNKVVWVTPRFDDWSYSCQEWLTMYADNALYKTGWKLWEEK